METPGSFGSLGNLPCSVQRDAERYLSASAGTVRDRKLLALAVKMRKAVANIRKPQPAAERLRWVAGCKTPSGIANLQDQAAVFALRRDGKLHRSVPGFHSMAKRILQQRLQNKLWHECLVQGWVNRI